MNTVHLHHQNYSPTLLVPAFLGMTRAKLKKMNRSENFSREKTLV